VYCRRLEIEPSLARLFNRRLATRVYQFKRSVTAAWCSLKKIEPLIESHPGSAITEAQKSFLSGGLHPSLARLFNRRLATRVYQFERSVTAAWCSLKKIKLPINSHLVLLPWLAPDFSAGK
jgi:uncharacterized membrane protein